MFLSQHDSDTYVDSRRTSSSDQNLLTVACSPLGHTGLRGLDGIFQSGGLERFRRAAGVYGWGGLDDRLRRFPLKRRSATARQRGSDRPARVGQMGDACR
jgi:hypothetical protein